MDRSLTCPGRRPAGRRLAAALLLALGLVTVQANELGGVAASDAALQMADWVHERADNRAQPYAIVDKQRAQLFVFDADGRLAGATPVLIGQQPGDETVPGVGDKPPSQVRPEERTTPAGRFASEPGRNLSGEDVVWVDYDSGFAIHRLRPGASYAPRLQRLRSPDPRAHRVSLGCIVVPVAFYEHVVAPRLGQHRGVVYVLPETRPLASLWASAQADRQALR
jgi:hypothetical protein